MSELAIIIPVLDDTAALAGLLADIRAWPSQPGEIVVAASASTPELETLCATHACRMDVSEPCRGRQLDAGARTTSADVLWFVHADAKPSAASLAAIGAALAAGADSGCFHFQFTGAADWRKRTVEQLVALRIRCGGVPYGDQGLWVTREAYLDCGGFAHEPLFEEVRLIRCLRGRGRFVALEEPIGVSPRRYERDGWLRRCAANRLLAFGHALGIPPARLAGRYHRTRLATDNSR